MASAIHQLQGSYKVYPSWPSSWSSGSKLKDVSKLQAVVRKEKFVSLKCKSCLSVGVPLALRPRCKQLKISAFKGSGHDNESGNRATGSKSFKGSVRLSYAHEESEETLESPKANNIPISYTSEDETSTHFLSVHNLFKNWLSIMRTLPPNQVVKESIEEPSTMEKSEIQTLSQRKYGSLIVKAVLRYFLGLDATIVIPLLIFVPWYLAVNVVYGAEVSKELTPLWVLGPLIVALYIKMLRGICALYAFSFKMTVKVVKNLPTYFMVAFSYIARGKLKEDIHARLVQPVVDIKNLDYKELSRRKLKDLQSFLVEKYLDFVESVWPYYCRTIRFLKRANLI